jgi:serpin B
MHIRRRLIAYITIIITCLTGIAAAPAVDRDQPSPDKKQAKGNNVFALNMYQQLRAAEGNLFFSPYSIRTALAMTYAGAKGRTAEQMETALNFTQRGIELHKGFAESIRTLNAGGGDDYDINIANSLWGDTTCKFLPPFREVIQSSYNSGLKKVDFINSAESARIKINTWVEEQTRERIKDLIPPGGVNNNTRLALVNAVYFKGFWSEQFNKELTRNEPFKHADGKTTQTALMRFTKASDLPFFAGDGIKIVELDYRGNNISMVILLPDAADGLADLEARLNEFQLNRWLESLQKQKVIVHLPRFSMNWGAKNIVPDLRALGMRDAFVSKVANFSGIDGSRNLLISSVFHKSFVEVNEEGTEAAAATGVMVGVTSMPLPPEVFRADHPFLFLIREKTTGTILFMGRLSEPDTE